MTAPEPLALPRLGVGCWAWGDRSTWGMGGSDPSYDEGTIREAWEASIAAGATLFDTAEIYGGGESERIIGRLLAADPSARSRIVLATKFMPSPWKLDVKRSLVAAARASLDRLGTDVIDLYQLHGPVSLRSKPALAEALAAAHEAGLVRAVGVSNYSEREMRAIDSALRAHGLRLASNQVEYSLLRRRPEHVGLLAACQELDVALLAYSPIGQGRLTGKYSAAEPPPKGRRFSAHPMAAIDAVVAELRRVGDAHGDATPSQVALAWLIAKGAVPIPGAKNRRQAEENAGALRVELAADEVAALDAVALPGTSGVAQRFWQHG